VVVVVAVAVVLMMLVVVVGCYCGGGGVDGSKSKEMWKQTVVCLWLMMTKHFPPAKVELNEISVSLPML
jgi:hypothetical protein